MTLEVEVGGRLRSVEVRRGTDAWLISVDGRQMIVDGVRAGGRWSLLIADQPRSPGADGGEDASGRGAPQPRRSHDVAIRPNGGRDIVVHVDGEAVAVRVSDPVRTRGERRRDAGTGPGDAGTQEVRAPMPGRVVRVLVEPGDAVAPRQGLIVVEAMKMENELRATRAGTVTAVRVTEGASVDANAVLVVIEGEA